MAATVLLWFIITVITEYTFKNLCEKIFTFENIKAKTPPLAFMHYFGWRADVIEEFETAVDGYLNVDMSNPPGRQELSDTELELDSPEKNREREGDADHAKPS